MLMSFYILFFYNKALRINEVGIEVWRLRKGDVRLYRSLKWKHIRQIYIDFSIDPGLMGEGAFTLRLLL
jgi:hypothetical protein